ITEVGGNVGVGTATPLSLLHVKAPSAQYRLESTGTGPGNYALETYAAGGVGKFTVGLDGDLSSNRLAVYDIGAAAYTTTWSGGNFGVGTTNPTQLLHVKSTNAQFRLESNGSGPGNYAMETFAAGGVAKFNMGVDGDLSSNKLAVYDIAAGLYTTTWSAGNVGIGTLAP